MKNGKGNPPLSPMNRFGHPVLAVFRKHLSCRFCILEWIECGRWVVPCLMQVLQDCSIHCLQVLLHLKYANPPKVSTLSANADKPVHDSSE